MKNIFKKLTGLQLGETIFISKVKFKTVETIIHIQEKKDNDGKLLRVAKTMIQFSGDVAESWVRETPEEIFKIFSEE